MPTDAPRLDRVHRRSVGFLDREGETWACFLVTWQDRDQRWHGYFSFRPRGGHVGEDEIRTADIFLEDAEEEIDRKARDLGRPLLNGLLASALHTSDAGDEAPPHLRQWFREMLSENSLELTGQWSPPPPGEVPGDREEAELARLRSLYASYRMDQVAHFICLVDPDDFTEAVDRILDGQAFDFGAKDRLQFAMLVVEHIENLLALPPFDIWVEDYLGHPETYQLYAHTLHREGRLP